MIIDCIADLHGHYPQLEGGDLLIIAGDLTASDTPSQYLKFREWLIAQDYRKKIFVAGNHDGCIESGVFYFSDSWLGAEYLFDSGTQFEGLTIWGTPWTPLFSGVNHRCKAFMTNELRLHWAFSKIPEGIDILITHGPANGILDNCISKRRCGSKSLATNFERVKPKLHVSGHLHENAGKYTVVEFDNDEYEKDKSCISLNCSHVNINYDPVNKPVRVVMEEIDGDKTFTVRGLCLQKD